VTLGTAKGFAMMLRRLPLILVFCLFRRGIAAEVVGRFSNDWTGNRILV